MLDPIPNPTLTICPSRGQASWDVMFVDGIVVFTGSRKQMEERLDSWRYALEKRGMKVSRTRVSESKTGETTKRRGSEGG